MKRQVRLALVLPAVLAVQPAWAADQPFTVQPETPVTANVPRRPLANNSPSLAVDPTEPRFAAVAAKVDAPDYACNLHLSGDGGRLWAPAIPVVKLPRGAEKCYGPSVAFDSDGTLFYLFSGLAGPNNAPMGAFITSSSDRGRTFGPVRRVLGPNSFMVKMAIQMQGQNEGRIHVVWVRPTERPIPTGFSGPNTIMSRFSDDGGKTFSRPLQVSRRSRWRVIAPAVAAGGHDDLHVVYYDLLDDVRDYMGLEGPTWAENWEIASATSVDGGTSFAHHHVVDAEIVPPHRLPIVFTAPAPALTADSRGRVYAAWGDSRNGDPDTLLRVSPDRGLKWGATTRVNDDPRGNGKTQVLPGLSVSATGRLDAVFYDRRADPENVRNHVSYSYSHDRGKSFSASRTVTSEPSDSRAGVTFAAVPSAKNHPEYGAGPAIDNSAHHALLAWTDARWAREPGQLNIVAGRIEWRGSSEAHSRDEGLELRHIALAFAFLMGLLQAFAYQTNRRNKRRTGQADKA